MSEQGAIDSEFADAAPSYEERLANALADIRTEPVPGSLAIDGGEAAWRDADTVQQLYHNERMSMQEVADELGCSIGTLHKWMKRNNIERRDQYEESARSTRKRPAMFETDDQGYEQWRGETSSGSYRVRVHRLLAVAEYGLNAVVGNVVHHKNGVRWDNRPQNLEVMARREHNQLHHDRGDFDEAIECLTPGQTIKLTKNLRKEIKAKYQSEDVSQRELAEEYGLSSSSVHRAVTEEVDGGAIDDV